MPQFMSMLATTEEQLEVVSSYNSSVIQRLVDEGYTSSEINAMLLEQTRNDVVGRLVESGWTRQRAMKAFAREAKNQNMIPEDMAKEIDRLQEQRAKRNVFGRKSTCNDVRAYLRHKLACDPHDAKVQQWVERVRGTLSFLHDMIQTKRIKTFKVTLKNVDSKNGDVDIAVVCRKNADPQAVYGMVQKASQVSIH